MLTSVRVFKLSSKIDGREASKIVKQYFEELHGMYGVLIFSIEDVKFDKDQKLWEVRCGFFPSLAAGKKDYYKVKVSDDRKIVDVEKIKTMSW